MSVKHKTAKVSQATQLRALYAQYQDLPDEEDKWAHAAKLEKATICAEARRQLYKPEIIPRKYKVTPAAEVADEYRWSSEKFRTAIERQQTRLTAKTKPMDATRRLFATIASEKPQISARELGGCLPTLRADASQFPDPCCFGKQFRGLLKLEDPAFVTHESLAQLETNVRVLAKVFVALSAKVYAAQRLVAQAGNDPASKRLKLELKKHRCERLLKQTYLMLAELVVTIVTIRRRAVLRRLSKDVSFHQAALSSPILKEKYMFDQMETEEESKENGLHSEKLWARFSPKIIYTGQRTVTPTVRRQRCM